MKNWKWMSFCLAAACVSGSVATAADTFFSGTIDVDGTSTGGSAFTGVSGLTFGGGNVYDNAWTADAPTPNVIGPGDVNKLTTMGFFPITGVNVNGTPQSLNGERLVAIVAMEGRQAISADGRFVTPEFDPSFDVPGLASFPDKKAHALFRVYSFGDVDPVLSSTDPTTWVPGNGTFLENIKNRDNIVADFRTVPAVTSIKLGPPGKPTTDIVDVIDTSILNTFPADGTGQDLTGRGDVLFEFDASLVGAANGSGLVFNNPKASSAFGDGVNADDPQAPQKTTDLLLLFDHETFLPGAQPMPNPQNIADLNILFDAILEDSFGGEPGDHPFSDETRLGNDLDVGQNFASGDISFEIQSAIAYPGGVFVPEPSAFFLGLTGILSALSLCRSKRRRTQDAHGSI